MNVPHSGITKHSGDDLPLVQLRAISDLSRAVTCTRSNIEEGTLILTSDQPDEYLGEYSINTWLVFEYLAGLVFELLYIQGTQGGSLSSRIDVEHVR
jgi:hypothetical protein